MNTLNAGILSVGGVAAAGSLLHTALLLGDGFNCAAVRRLSYCLSEDNISQIDGGFFLTRKRNITISAPSENSTTTQLFALIRCLIVTFRHPRVNHAS